MLFRKFCIFLLTVQLVSKWSKSSRSFESFPLPSPAGSTSLGNFHFSEHDRSWSPHCKFLCCSAAWLLFEYVNNVTLSAICSFIGSEIYDLLPKIQLKGPRCSQSQRAVKISKSSHSHTESTISWFYSDHEVITQIQNGRLSLISLF